MELKIACICLIVACIMSLGLALHYKRKSEELGHALYCSTKALAQLKRGQQPMPPKVFENALTMLFALNDFERIGNGLIDKIKSSSNTEEIKKVQIDAVTATLEAVIKDMQIKKANQ